jgi:hypothetical protein
MLTSILRLHKSSTLLQTLRIHFTYVYAYVFSSRSLRVHYNVTGLNGAISYRGVNFMEASANVSG